MRGRLDRRSFLAGLGAGGLAAIPGIALLRDSSDSVEDAVLPPAAGPGTRLTWVNLKDAGVPVGEDKDCGPPASKLTEALPSDSGRMLYVPAAGVADFFTPWIFDGAHQGIQIVGDGPYNSWLRQRDATHPIMDIRGEVKFVSIRNLLFSRASPINEGSAPAIRVDGSSGALSHVVFDNCVFEGCFGAFHSDAREAETPSSQYRVVDITFRNCVFQSCAGDNVKATMPGYFSNVQFDQCFFQSEVFRTYISLLGSGTDIGNIHFQRTNFEGGGRSPNVAGMELGGVANATFVNCQTADWQPNPGFQPGVPIIKTQGGPAGSRPRDLTFVGCFMFNQIGPAVRITPEEEASSHHNGQWQIIGGKWAVSPPYQAFDFTAGPPPDTMTIMGSEISVQNDWARSAVNIYNSLINNLLVRHEQVN